MTTDATAIAVMRKAAAAATAAAPGAGALLGPSVANVLGAAGAGLALAADLASIGCDPVAEIHRIRDTHTLLQGVDARWHDRLVRRFGALASLPPDSSDDIYAALDTEARQS